MVVIVVKVFVEGAVVMTAVVAVMLASTDMYLI